MSAAAAPDLFAASARRPAAPAASAIAAVAPADGARGHTCRVCGAVAGFGFGVFLRRGLEGRWACARHRHKVEGLPE